MKRLLTLTLLFCLFGCEESTPPNQPAPGATAQNPPAPPPSSPATGATAQNPPAPPPPFSPATSNTAGQSPATPVHNKLRLDIGSEFKDEGFQKESFENLDPGLIEAKIRALPWNDPNYSCQVTLEEELEDSEVIKALDMLQIGGSLKASKQQDRVSAQMNESPDGTLHIFYCNKIQSVDQIVAMCLSYFRNDGKLRTIVKWIDSMDDSVLSMSIYVPTKDGESEEESYDELNPQLIESKVRALDWKASGTSPCVYMMYSLVKHIQVKGSLNPNNSDGSLTVRWLEMNDQQRIQKEYRKAKSIDEVIPILISYFKKDGQYKTMVPWEDEKE